MAECNCTRNTVDTTYLGTGIKISLSITAQGFSMDSDDFKCVFKCGKKSLTVKKEEMYITEDDVWIVPLDTSKLAVGKVTMIVYAYIPDPDWTGGIRTEVCKKELLYINNI